MKYVDLRQVYHCDGGNHIWGHRLQGLVMNGDEEMEWVDIPSVCIPDETPPPAWMTREDGTKTEPETRTK